MLTDPLPLKTPPLLVKHAARAAITPSWKIFARSADRDAVE
jgi:hypothetical protein